MEISHRRAELLVEWNGDCGCLKQSLTHSVIAERVKSSSMVAANGGPGCVAQQGVVGQVVVQMESQTVRISLESPGNMPVRRGLYTKS